MTITLEAIRAAGGIVHSDGNIFFRDISMLQGLAGAAPAAVAGSADEREAFETWARSRTDWNPNLERKGDGYAGGFAQAAWEAWRGRGAAPALEAPAAPAGDLALIIAALEHGQPQMAHYAEPCERHAKALAAARRMAAAPQAPAAPVAYLDLGAGGYMDLGTDLSEQQLGALPKGRHMLAIIGTYGIDGYAAAPAAPAVDAPALGEWVATLEVDSEGGLDYETVPPCTLPPGCYRLYRAAQAKEGGAA